MNSLFRDYELVIRSGLFDPAHYLATNPDVARRNIDPLTHYLEEGARAGRDPHPDFDAAFYLAQCRVHGHKPENPLLHFLTVGIGLGFKPKPDRAEPPDANGSRGSADGEPLEAGRPPMQLYVDETAVGPDGILRVVGWAVCLAPIASVDVVLDDEPLGAAELGRLRPDVEEIRSDYPNARLSGFLFVGDIGRFGPGVKGVTVRATAQTGIVRELVASLQVPELRPRAPAAPVPIRFHCDRAVLTTTGHLSIGGWIVGAARSVAMEVLIDGAKAGDAQLGIERADVGNLFPLLPHARLSGFAFAHRAGRPFTGEHQITLRVRQADDRTEEVGVPVFATARDIDPAPAGEEVTARDHRLVLDVPALIDGRVETPIRGNLEISGWALARTGVAAIEIAVDDAMLVEADYGLRRLDVRSAFSDWEHSLESGFVALLPHRLLPRGGHKVTVTLRDNSGRTSDVDFRIVVEALPDASGPWALRSKMPAAEVVLAEGLLAAQRWRPAFHVILTAARETDPRDLYTTVASLAAQAYGDWRLVLQWDRAAIPAGPWCDRLDAALAALGAKCEVFAAGGDGGSDDAESFVSVLTPGCKLGCDAFLEIALATALHRESDFFYSDERKPNPETGKIEAFFKPQWSPDLLLATNYLGQLWCARGDLFRRATAADSRELADPYDLVLRLTEAARGVVHVPRVLCERPAPPRGEGERAATAALARAAARRGVAGEIVAGLLPGSYRLKRRLADEALVSIIIPTRAAGGMIRRCIETIRERTAYRHFEIVSVENIPADERQWRDWLDANADRVVRAEGPFNWSRFNNQAVAAARGAYLLFLNDDTEITDPEWLGVLLSHAQRPEVGIVGPLLLYPDGRIQHAGMFLAGMAQARHAFRYAAADDGGYFDLALTERNVIAVTGACLLTRREVFERLGGFDEAHDIVNNDLDYCLRVHEAGLATIYTPHTRLIHHEAVSRAGIPDDFDAAAFDGKWRDVFLRGDPFFSPHLSRAQDALAPDDEPNRLVVSGRPALLREGIKKILAVKLDHIGDCVMAFPAVRRLKAHFPGSRITVLTSRATRAVWTMEPAVDATIEFDFFHTRSSLGQIGLSDEDWRGLADRLRPERFDLAIDLRRHLETRPVLRHSGARYLAGVDYRGKFPWLDVAVEWTGDPAFVHKRQHAVDDLINLVDAVAAACETERSLIDRFPAPASSLVDGLMAASRGRLVVCLHPTAGNDMKQWPVAYFAAVADRLIEAHDVFVVLIGAPGEEAAGEELLRRMRRAESAVSLIGRFPLADLPAVLRRCALFLGNDSGPKHIAAGLGVPTVAVQAGSVDVYEWGPVGPRAVAVVREVTCAPCYLPTPGDCRRGLACLRQLTPDAVYAACERMLLATDRRD
jgi:ADP-heptose:LPS heptosyltransferase/GT2 family glycosyltransferase